MTSQDLAKRIRRHIVTMTSAGKSSHVASGLSMADIVAVLSAGGMTVRPDEPLWDGRDRFILSKGYAGAAVAALSRPGSFPPKLATPAVTAPIFRPCRTRGIPASRSRPAARPRLEPAPHVFRAPPARARRVRRDERRRMR